MLLAEGLGFGVFVTMDKGVEYELNLGGRTIAMIIRRAKSNRLADILPLVTECLEVMRSIRFGQIVRVTRYMCPLPGPLPKTL